MNEHAAVQEARLEDGAVAHIALAGPKGNILTRAVVEALAGAFEAAGRDRHVRAILLTAQGRDFSFGASVKEHAPGEVETMLPAFCGLFRAIARAALPVSAAVRGRCLGGGFELALVAHHLVVGKSAALGLPEVTLASFPPVAAAVLPLRVPQPVVDRLVVLGETVGAEEAVRIGLADELAADEEAEPRALAWALKHAKLSGVAVRFATRAARAAWDEALGARLERLERLYLGELMATADAREGIAAFLEGRRPDWVHR